jgi:hypothetical protein
MSKTKKITVENTEISVILQNGTDGFICLILNKDSETSFHKTMLENFWNKKTMMIRE